MTSWVFIKMRISSTSTAKKKYSTSLVISETINVNHNEYHHRNDGMTPIN